MTPRDTLGVSAQNAEPVIRVGGSFRQIIVKLGVQFQRKAFAEFKIRVIVIAVVQKELGVAAATMMVHGLRPAKHACSALAAAAAAAAAITGSWQAVTKQTSEAESALQQLP